MAQTAEIQLELKERLKLLNQVLKDTHQLVQEEREHGPGMAIKLEQELENARLHLDKVSKKLSKAKAQIKKRKREITEWKQWYNGLEQLDKTEELKQLESEIKWRAEEITQNEAQIAELNAEHIEAEGQHEQLQIRLQALKEVDQSAPIEEDPRLQDIQAEIKQLTQQLG
ncbi:MAG: hypothetical protein ACPGJS_15165 [Flammeovirgaceae bacterium]